MGTSNLLILDYLGTTSKVSSMPLLSVELLNTLLLKLCRNWDMEKQLTGGVLGQLSMNW